MLLEVRGLVAGYGGVPVVRGIDLSVESGEVVALLGRNGAGKTTTLLAISNLIEPIAGEVLVRGLPSPGRRRAYRRALGGLAHVPEDRALLNQMTVAENLRLGSMRAHSPSSAIDEALDFFPALRPILRRRAGLLSGGEQQMLAIARGVASRPNLLVIDEMSLGLSPVIYEGMCDVLHAIVEQTGVGVLLVEQHVELALEMANRVYVLDRGEVVLQGPAADLQAQSSLLRANYLGGPPATNNT